MCFSFKRIFVYIKNLMHALVLSIVLAACGEAQKANYKLSDTTNNEWVKGVAKGWGTAFFVKNTDQAKTEFAIGKKVILSDGIFCTVTGNQMNGDNLIVHLDGEKLNGDLVGYPNSVKPQPL